MKSICKWFGHKMYSITWDVNAGDFTVLCIRCEKTWDKHSRLGVIHD